MDRLIYPRKSFDSEGRNIEPDWAHWVRRQTAHIVPDPDSPKRLYVSRNRARSRGVTNEEELVSALAPYGFVTVHPEFLPFVDQIRLFKSADVVIAPHGAGLVNIAYCNPQTLLIELMPTGSWQPDFYELLAQSCGLTYVKIPCFGAFEDKDFLVAAPDILSRLTRLI